MVGILLLLCVPLEEVELAVCVVEPVLHPSHLIVLALELHSKGLVSLLRRSIDSLHVRPQLRCFCCCMLLSRAQPAELDFRVRHSGGSGIDLRLKLEGLSLQLLVLLPHNATLFFEHLMSVELLLKLVIEP